MYLPHGTLVAALVRNDYRVAAQREDTSLGVYVSLVPTEPRDGLEVDLLLASEMGPAIVAEAEMVDLCRRGE